MRVLNNEGTEANSWALPDAVIHIPGVKKFRYIGEGVQRKRKLLLNGVVKSNNNYIAIGPTEYTINVYSIRVWKTEKGKKHGDPIEIMIGVSQAAISRAWSIIRSRKILFEHIETILSDEFNIPNAEEFDKIVEREANSAFRRIVRYDSRVNRNDTFDKNNFHSIDWVYIDDLEVI